MTAVVYLATFADRVKFLFEMLVLSRLPPKSYPLQSRLLVAVVKVSFIAGKKKKVFVVKIFFVAGKKKVFWCTLDAPKHRK